MTTKKGEPISRDLSEEEWREHLHRNWLETGPPGDYELWLLSPAERKEELKSLQETEGWERCIDWDDRDDPYACLYGYALMDWKDIPWRYRVRRIVRRLPWAGWLGRKWRRMTGNSLCM